MNVLNKTPMPTADPKVRARNFEEVALGYTAEMAMEEATRCLNCKHRPCVMGCPVGIAIPEFIMEVKEGNFEKAAAKIHEANLMPAICGRVCPQEKQCEHNCVRGIKGEAVAIGRLERFCADYIRENGLDAPLPVEEKNGIKVAVVGSGPAGLACAGELARMGYSVTVFEALHKAGGVLEYGIPEFRLPKSIVDHEVENLESLGVEIRTNFVVGRTETVDEIMADGYKAVFVASGAGFPNFMNVPGEDLNGVYSANEFLTRINLMKAYKSGSDTPIMPAKHICVIGGGNVAMDAARSALRIGAEQVDIVYRRTENELPARLEEIEHAKEEGVNFKLLTAPLAVMDDGNGWVAGLKCQEMRLGDEDETGRRRPEPVEGSEFIIDADCVVIAIGNSPNPLISRTTEGLEVNKRGCLILSDSESLRTPREGIYAGGDIVTGAATVILAMGAGKEAAKHMDAYIRGLEK